MKRMMQIIAGAVALALVLAGTAALADGNSDQSDTSAGTATVQEQANGQNQNVPFHGQNQRGFSSRNGKQSDQQGQGFGKNGSGRHNGFPGSGQAMPWSTLPDGSGSGTLPDGTNDPAGNGKRGGGKGGRISLEQIEQAIAALEDSETRTACEDALAALKQAQEDAQQEIEAINSRRQAVMDTVRNAEMELEQKLQEAGVLPVPQQGNLPGTPAGNGTAQDPLTGEGSGTIES